MSTATDLARLRHIHIVGVGGSGMSAIATVVAAMGHRVTGSDTTPSPVLDRLATVGIATTVGHDPALAATADLVAVSTAIPPDDPEALAARLAGVPVLRRAELLSAVCATRRTVAVSGTHGKTTTTAMLAVVLRAAGMEPSFIVGGEVKGLGSGAAWAPGGWFVVEADESDGTFLELGAEAVVVTNVEPDHLDHWGDFATLRSAFGSFMAEAPGPRVVCVDDPVAAELAEGLECLTYGTGESAQYRLVDVRTGRDGVAFTLRHGRDDLGRFDLVLPGVHNALNAAAAVTMALALGADVEAVKEGLAGFAGVRRRFERRGEAAGVVLIDSYDHLPAEVSAALAAARAGGWRRIVCVFQPHRYTRTAALWRDFAAAFDEADLLAVTEIYPAGQAPLPGITGKLILEAVLDANPWRRVAWLPGRPDLLLWLDRTLRPGDLCLTLGAGDLTTVPDDVLVSLASGVHQ